MRISGKAHIISFVSLLIIIVSCNGTGGHWSLFGNAEEEAKARHTLAFADSIMEVNPDSAYTLLCRDSSIICRTGKAERMMFSMLETQAQDKLYIPHTSDSLMREVVKYYEKHGTPKEQAQAYYLLGRVSYDLSMTASSMAAFKKVLEINDENPVTCRYKGQAASWLGGLFSDKRLYEKALGYNLLSYKLAKKSDIPKEQSVYALRDIGRAYSDLGRNKYAIGYYEKAAESAQEKGDTVLYTMVMGELCAIYIEENMLENAKQLLSLPLAYIPQIDLSPHYSTVGSYYEAKGYSDSAIFYYKRSIETGSLEANVMASLSIAEIYEKQNLFNKALEYRKLNKLYEDSLKKQSQIEASDNIRHLDENADTQKHNEELIKDKNIRSAIICIIVIVTLLVVFCVYLYFKNMKIRAEFERKRENNFWKQCSEKNAAKLRQEKELTKQLRQDLSSRSQIAIVIDKAPLDMDNTNKYIEKESKTISVEELVNSNIYSLFHKAVFKPKDEDFVLLKNSLDATYNNFTSRLRLACPEISIDEIYICCMLKIGLTPKEISTRLSYSPSTISMKRKRLYRKFFKKDGKAEDFDLFAKTF